MAVRIYLKYRCMSCPGTPWLDDAEAHLIENIGHELAMRTTSEFVPDPEPEEGDE